MREFTTVLAAGNPAYLADHPGPDGVATLPAAAYVELLLAAQDAVYGHTQGAILDLVLHRPLALPEEAVVEVRTRLRSKPDGGADVEVVSGPADDEIRHATATLDVRPVSTGPTSGLDRLAENPGEPVEQVGPADIYTDFASVGRDYGDGFRALNEVMRHQNGVFTASVTLRQTQLGEYVPVEALECALQAVTALDEYSPAFTPAEFGGVRLYKKPRGRRLRVVVRSVAQDPTVRTADLLLLEESCPSWNSPVCVCCPLPSTPMANGPSSPHRSCTGRPGSAGASRRTPTAPTVMCSSSATGTAGWPPRGNAPTNSACG